MRWIDPVRWFSRFKIPSKLLIISLSFVLPIAVMLHLIIEGISKDIRFSTLEVYGLEYQRPLAQLLYDIPFHLRFVRLNAIHEGNQLENMQATQGKIDKAFADLKVVDAKIGVDLQFTDEGLAKRNRSHLRVEVIKKEWENLKRDLSEASLEDLIERHYHLVTDILEMILHNGDTSNLILDPDLDTYYLMDIVLNTIPGNQDRISKALNFCVKAFQDGVLSIEERDQIMIYSLLLKDVDLTRMSSSVVTALNEDKNFHGISPSLSANILPAFESYQKAMQNFVDIINKDLKMETVDASLMEEYLILGTTAKSEGFKLWHIAMDELENMLKVRINSHKHKRRNAFIWIFFSLGLSVSLVYLITQSILNPFNRLLIGIGQISKGGFKWDQVNQPSWKIPLREKNSEINFKTIEVTTSDEIGELTKTFNVMTEELKGFYQKLESRVRQRTHELEESREYSRSIIETANDAFIAINEEGLIVNWNKRAQEIFGWAKEEVLGKGLAELIIPPEFREAHRKGLQRFVKTRESSNLGKTLELKAIRRNGEEFPVETTMWALFLNQNMYINSFLRDISKRKAAEKGMMQLASAIESVGDMIIITDDHGIIQYVNSAFERITGYQRQELVGRKSNVLNSGKQDSQFYRRLWDTILQGNVWRGVFVNKKKTGYLFDVEATITPIQEQGRTVSYVAVERDVTERRWMMKKLQDAFVELKDREKDLRKTFEALRQSHDALTQTQSQLLQSEKMASIGQLAAGIAHEINNPVGFISSNVQIFQQYMNKLQRYVDKIKEIQAGVKTGDAQFCKQGLADLEQLENEINLSGIIQDINTMLKESLGGVERVVRIVNDLRNFSRADDGSINYANIHDAIDMSVNIVWNEIKYQVELKKNYGELPPVKCNPQKLGQVIMNLLINASQAIKERGIVEIKTYKDKTHAYIEVSDTGRGIPEENLKKIFDPFFTTKPVGKGTGLGLSISYDIIKKHDGEINVSSVVGKGTTFTIKLPL